MPDWILYCLGAAVMLALLSRPAILLFFPDSDLACWLDTHWPETFDSGGDGCDGDGD